MIAVDAQRLALRLMGEHGLIEQGWRFKFDTAKVRFGQCRYGTKTISMSRPLVELNEIDRVRNTILHEIAHALAGPRAGHGYQWKQTARAIGCDANRCYDAAEVEAPPRRWIGTCPSCGETTTRDKLGEKMKRYACSRCCKRLNGGRFSAEFIFYWKRNPEAA